MTTLIRSTNIWGYDDLVRELGGDPVALRARHGVPPGVEHLDDHYIPYLPISRLYEDTAAELGAPDFGLRLAAHQGLAMLGPVAVIARNSDSVAEGVGAIARFLHVHSPALKLAAEPPDEAGDVRFRYWIEGLVAAEHCQSYEVSMANSARIVRLLSGGTEGPRTIYFLHHQLGPDRAYQEALGCEVVFGAESAGFLIPASLLARPLDSADPETRRMATAYLEAAGPRAGSSLADTVGELVRRLLPTGHFSAADLADGLHVHLRTLQRQLAEEGTTYAAILDEQRRLLAIHYLAEPGLQVGQIATLLGYTEQSTFNRSFRRWFATSPRAYRRSSPGPSSRG